MAKGRSPRAPLGFRGYIGRRDLMENQMKKKMETTLNPQSPKGPNPKQHRAIRFGGDHCHSSMMTGRNTDDHKLSTVVISACWIKPDSWKYVISENLNMFL